MKVKIICILVMTLFIAAAVLPAVGTKEIRSILVMDGKELTISTNRLVYSQEEEMAITVENTGNETVHFFDFPKIEIFDVEGRKVFPSYTEEGNWTLEPGESEMYVWDQRDLEGNLVDPGEITIKTISELMVEAVFWPHIFGIGYVVLVAGDHGGWDTRCDSGTKEIYDDLIDIGFTGSRIQYLNKFTPGDPKVDDTASRETVRDAIKVWAAARVCWFEPLYIIMFDHGGNNVFCVDDSGPGGDTVTASELRSWIDYLCTATCARIDVWYMACRSGSFIDEVSRNGKIIITSTCANNPTAGGPAPYYEYFTQYFWNKIKCGYTWGEAFNYGGYHAHKASSVNIPQLDDNGDSVGHGVYDCNGVYQGNLPHDGDGAYAMSRYMGRLRLRCWWQKIEIEWLNPSLFYPDFTKQTVDTIPLWAVIESEVSLSNVSAGMLDPNWPPEDVGCFDEVPCEYFEMADEDHDGEWTVDIPIEEFTKYPDATDFTFLIHAEDEEGTIANPLKTNVYLRSPFEDDELPFVNIDNPRDGQVVSGTLNIKGRASDNIQLEMIELYLGDNLLQTIVPPPSSHYYFEFPIDLVESEGTTTIRVDAYDASYNKVVNEIEITIVGAPVKPETPSGPTSGKVGEEYTYTAVTADPQGDKVFYMWDWGDGSNSGWLGPYSSGETCESSYVWNEKGDYSIKVKAKDVYGAVSDWSDPLVVTMPRDKTINRSFLNFLQSHPNMFPLLQLILQRLGLY